jgi:hypothetical protein
LEVLKWQKNPFSHQKIFKYPLDSHKAFLDEIFKKTCKWGRDKNDFFRNLEVFLNWVRIQEGRRSSEEKLVQGVPTFWWI